METIHEKCIMLIDEGLPLGLIANTAAILGSSLAHHKPEIIGCDVIQEENKKHTGIINIPVPVLKADGSLVKEIRQKLYEPEYADLLVIDFTDLAQTSLSYEDYMEKMSTSKEADVQYLGIAIFGNKKKVNKLTGSLPLLR